MAIKADEISKIIQRQIEGFETEADIREIGTVISVGDGIARIHGLDRVMYNELLEFPHNVFGLALNLEEDSVGAVLLGESHLIKESDIVKRTRRIMEVPSGPALVGRVVDPLGKPLDGKFAEIEAMLDRCGGDLSVADESFAKMDDSTSSNCEPPRKTGMVQT